MENGWNGRGADVNNYRNDWLNYPGYFYQLDVTIKENVDILFMDCPPVIDFLSLDVDDAGYICLTNINFEKYKFRCICIEHDYYVNGEKLRLPQRKLLQENGYLRVIQTAAEDWWVYPNLVESNIMEILNNIPPHSELTGDEMPIILEWLNYGDTQ